MPANCGLLFVEDDIAIREALSHILAAEHYCVFTASSLEEALSAYRSNRIDLVLLDLKLGVENGWDVFRALKKLNPDLPVVITSAQPERFLNPTTVSPSGVLEKPFEVSALLALLAAVRCPSENHRATSGTALPLGQCSLAPLRQDPAAGDTCRSTRRRAARSIHGRVLPPPEPPPANGRPVAEH